MTNNDVASSPDDATPPATVTLVDLQVAFTTLLQVHETITDLKARCLSAADIESANRMIHALESRLSGYKLECDRLSENLREAERRTRVYKRRSEDAESKLIALQRTISLRLTEHLIEDDMFGALPLESPQARQTVSPP
jgi:hypothetical protein